MTAAHSLQILLDLVTTFAFLVGAVIVLPQALGYAASRLLRSNVVGVASTSLTLVGLLYFVFEGGIFIGPEPEIDGIRWTFVLSLVCINLFASGIVLGPLRDLWRLHQSLPRILRVQWLVPFSVAVVTFSARLFELPPGPLCDEGMILFMEGGCDYGVSNIFFHSKLGLLASLNIAFVVAWIGRTRVQPLGFAPHFLIAGCLALANWSGGYCDTYYKNPNGSIGQMVIETAAFALLGIVILERWSGARLKLLLLALVGWNLAHVGLFYLWLSLFDHWTWIHSAALTLTLASSGIALRSSLLDRKLPLEG